MTKTLTIVSVLLVYASFAQQSDDTLLNLVNPNIKYVQQPIEIQSVEIKLKSEYSKEGAELAIKNNDLKILFPGGFGGVPNLNSKEDKEFQKKYNVKFICQGCVRFGEDEDEEGYNEIIFSYLDQKYGKMWRYEIRNDAIGFNPPKHLPSKNLIDQESIQVPIDKENNEILQNHERVNLDYAKPYNYSLWLIISILSVLGLLLLIFKKRKIK